MQEPKYNAKERHERRQLRDVPERFETEQEYIDTFVPLLLEEVTAQAQQRGTTRTTRTTWRLLILLSSPPSFIIIIVSHDFGG